MTDTDELAGRLDEAAMLTVANWARNRDIVQRWQIKSAAALRALRADRDEALEAAHYSKGVADLAIKHRDSAEATIATQAQEIAALREALNWLYGEPEWWDTPRGFRDLANRARALATTKGSEDAL